MWAGLANSYYWIDRSTGVGGRRSDADPSLRRRAFAAAVLRIRIRGVPVAELTGRPRALHSAALAGLRPARAPFAPCQQAGCKLQRRACPYVAAARGSLAGKCATCANSAAPASGAITDTLPLIPMQGAHRQALAGRVERLRDQCLQAGRRRHALVHRAG